MTDQALVRKYIAGEEAGLAILLDRYQSKVFTSIYLLINDRELAEDIFQDTFIKVIENLRKGRYNDEGKFLYWVSRIARNLVIDHFRRERKNSFIAHQEGYDIFDTLAVGDENAEERMIREQSHARLRRMIQRLPDDQKEVLIMRHYGEMSFREISDITEVSINTALGRMRYALNNLKKMMEEASAVKKTG